MLVLFLAGQAVLQINKNNFKLNLFFTLIFILNKIALSYIY